MDDKDPSEIINNFEAILKNQECNRVFTVYGEKQHENLGNQNTKPVKTVYEILSNVSSQIKDLQKADAAKKCRKNREISTHHKKSLVSVNMLPVTHKVPHRQITNTAKYETQGFSDSQLLHIIQDAEALESSSGVTQEFDITFQPESAKTSLIPSYDKVDNPITSIKDNNAVSCKGMTDFIADVPYLEGDSIKENLDEDVRNVYEFPHESFDDNPLEQRNNNVDSNYTETKNSFNRLDANLKQMLKKSAEIELNTHSTVDVDLPASPIFKPLCNKLNITPFNINRPLVFNLEDFERFEEIAVPVVGKTSDFMKARELINSQIMDNELCIAHSKPNIVKEETDEYVSDLKDIDKCTPCVKYEHDSTLTAGTLFDKSEFGSVVKLSISLDNEVLSSALNVNKPIDDEILFSSDEEDPYFENNKDLPFTCALETSFYDQSDVLDRTMFVGFQTASSKTIQINTESFVKAKSLLSDSLMACEEFTLTELVEKCNNTDSCKAEKCKSEPVMSSSIDIKETSQKEPLNDKSENSVKSKLADFTSDNNIILDKVMITVDTFVNRAVDKNMNATTFKEKGTANVDLNVEIAEESLKLVDDDVIKEFENDEMSFVEDKIVHEFLGFQTASSKNIKISHAAIEKTKHMLANLDDEIFLQPLPLKIQANNKMPNGLQDQKTTEFSGFKTASNKEIKISELTFAKTKHFFDDIDSINAHDLKNIYDSNDEVGFKTASNKIIAISNTAIAKSRKILENLDKCDIKNKSHGNFNTNHVSKKLDNQFLETIQQGEKETINGLNKQISCVDNSLEVFQGFRTASNKNIQVSAKARSASAKILQDLVDDHQYLDTPGHVSFLSNKQVEKFNGFQTASNKPVKISAKALTNSKVLLESILEEKIQSKHNSYDTGKKDNSSTEKHYTVQLRDVAVERQKSPDHDKCCTDIKNNNGLKSFLAKSDETIIVSNQTLPHDDNEINLITQENIHQSKARKFLGFQTASNKPVKISEKAIAKSKLLLKELQDTDTTEIDLKKVVDVEKYNTKNYSIPSNEVENSNRLDKQQITSIPPFVGFQTASKKRVKVSKEALARSNVLLRNLDEDTAAKESINDNKLNGVRTVTIKKAKQDKQINNNKDVLVFPGKFVGFQTASKKTVKISEEALAKSKILFDDFDEQTFSNVTKFKGFETASNKQVKVSEEAIAVTKDLFKDIEEKDFKVNTAYKPNESYDKSLGKITPQTVQNNPTDYRYRRKVLNLHEKDIVFKPESNIDNIINTQVLNNFEETLCTEDFAPKITPVKRIPKRSGSPILSCPRAKKRKRFETPYRNKSDKVIVASEEKPILSKEDIQQFSTNYKKDKRYSLKDISVLEKYSSETVEIDAYIKEFNYDNLLDFVFVKQRNDINKTGLKIADLKTRFLDSINRKIVPDNWFENHIRLIIWKLFSYELKYPIIMGGICTARNVLEQLKYRYDRELYHVQRPALRKIFEKDEVPSRVIVLCVVGVYMDDVLTSTPKSQNNLELLLTDGWYNIKACLDKMLCQLVCNGLIKVGCKIVTHGAELVNCEQGIAPWEDTSAVRLKLSGNSTRRARWDARLGFHGNAAAILSQLSAVRTDGGKVSKLRLYVARVYPALYIEKFEDGSTVTRSERLEQRYQMKYESERQVIMEKVYEEIEKEFSDQESQDSEMNTDTHKRKSLDSGSQIAKMMKRSKDPSEFRATLTSSQMRQLQEHNQAKRESLLQQIQRRVEEKISEIGLNVTRNVVPVLKIRVAGVKDGVVTKGMMSIWKPSEAISEVVAEGAWIDVMNVIPTGVRYSEIQLSAGRQTMFLKHKQEDEKLKKYTDSLKRKCCHIKSLNQFPSNMGECGEIDTVGVIISIEPTNKDFETTKASPFQNVYLADSEKNLISINFWGGLKKFGYEITLDTGQIVACMNLQKRAGNTSRNILQYRATEFSFFTKTPKNEELRTSLEEIVKKFKGIDRRKFCDDCVAIRNKCSRLKFFGNNENISPYRFNNTSDLNISRNKMDKDSSIMQNKCDLNLNLTGLDFESTFVQVDTQELSPKTMLRKKRLNERIAKLKMYGEPPPLSPIHIINKSKNASSSYKSPLAAKSDSTISGVNSKLLLDESPKTTISKNNSHTSPIISMVKRIVTKNIVPTKLNFTDNVAMKENASDLVENFSDDFDGSPPLSLDSTSC